VNAAEDLGSKAKVVRQPDSMPSSSLPMHGFVEHEDRGQKQGLLPAAYMEGQDFEAPMPPHTLAPLPDYDPSRCLACRPAFLLAFVNIALYLLTSKSYTVGDFA